MRILNRAKTLIMLRSKRNQLLEAEECDAFLLSKVQALINLIGEGDSTDYIVHIAERLGLNEYLKVDVGTETKC